jgi:hypothetical protein
MQDAKGGFDMVTAMRSAVPAGTPLIDGDDRAGRGRREFDPTRAAGLDTRAVFVRMPPRPHHVALQVTSGRARRSDRLQRHCSPNRVTSVLAPRVLTRSDDRLHHLDRACHVATCRCLRCTYADVISGTAQVVRP